TLFFPVENMEIALYTSALFFLITLGATAAKTGGSSIRKAVLRITFWGTIAMGLTAFVGYLFGISV
ncbi:VIT family protein, partial [Flavobacteriaceae bacterium]|nr:VIT family protein [Flavobacteriaceae bacterium]